jgi:hypothetical protein
MGKQQFGFLSGFGGLIDCLTPTFQELRPLGGGRLETITAVSLKMQVFFDAAL